MSCITNRLYSQIHSNPNRNIVDDKVSSKNFEAFVRTSFNTRRRREKLLRPKSTTNDSACPPLSSFSAGTVLTVVVDGHLTFSPHRGTIINDLYITRFALYMLTTCSMMLSNVFWGKHCLPIYSVFSGLANLRKSNHQSSQFPLPTITNSCFVQ